MTTDDEIEGLQRERESYLLALYDLTKDSDLRWSTHREVGAKADIPEDRIMAISRHLVGERDISIRTMGGLDGYVELLPKGIREAERLIQSRGSSVESPLVTVDGQTSVLERPDDLFELDRHWAERYLTLVRLAFTSFASGTTWPETEPLQRALDQANAGIDVQVAMRELPRAPGEARLMMLTNPFIPLRVLRHLPEAAPVLEICFQLLQRAVDLYYSDTEKLELNSADPLLSLPGTPAVAQVAARLLMSDAPSPVAGGSYGPDGAWTLGVNGATARRFTGLTSLDDYFTRQLQIRAEGLAQLREGFSGAVVIHESEGAPSVFVGHELTLGESGGGSGPPVIFIVMPFGEDWSTGVYDFIRRAVRSLDMSDDRVIRADSITENGMITLQILAAIRRADAIVADITGCNPNVMWELGYAEALQVPTVILNQRIDQSPFDLANLRQVHYRLAPTDDDEARLAAHIRSALDDRQQQTGP